MRVLQFHCVLDNLGFAETKLEIDENFAFVI